MVVDPRDALVASPHWEWRPGMLATATEHDREVLQRVELIASDGLPHRLRRNCATRGHVRFDRASLGLALAAALLAAPGKAGER